MVLHIVRCLGTGAPLAWVSSIGTAVARHIAQHVQTLHCSGLWASGTMLAYACAQRFLVTRIAPIHLCSALHSGTSQPACHRCSATPPAVAMVQYYCKLWLFCRDHIGTSSECGAPRHKKQPGSTPCLRWLSHHSEEVETWWAINGESLNDADRTRWESWERREKKFI